MGFAAEQPLPAPPDPAETALRAAIGPEQLPAPTTKFRRRAWLEFQRALDPLAPPRPLRLQRH